MRMGRKSIVLKRRSTDSMQSLLVMLELVIAAISFVGWSTIKLQSTYRKQIETFYPEVEKSKPHFWEKVVYGFLYGSILRQTSIIGFVLVIITCALFISNTFPPWIAVQMVFLFINLSSTSQYVIRSLLLNIDQLGVTAFLGILTVAGYAQITARFYRDPVADFMVYDLDSESVELSSKFCSSLLQCYGFILNLAVRNAGIGDILYEADYQGHIPQFFLRFLLDM